MERQGTEVTSLWVARGIAGRLCEHSAPPIATLPANGGTIDSLTEQLIRYQLPLFLKQQMSARTLSP